MTQKLQFRKSKIFEESVSENFPHESIHPSLQELLKGTELKSEEYIEQYFEKVETKGYLQITNSSLEKVLGEKYRDSLKYKLFDPKQTTFFMIDHQVWDGIEKILTLKIKEMSGNSENDQTACLEKMSGIMGDYAILSDLFKKKMLFANIF
ncbi:hypothetical protein NG799_14085 [Laspinema sp. D1]|uniref:Uncharacterized protein n=1 Tax=Laspinema palackyanum D2a TaxID=2953684 RepID=A0ABT2MRT9_9CYAN|nr:hypothetical protein [Laspinema sp. D2a]